MTLTFLLVLAGLVSDSKPASSFNASPNPLDAVSVESGQLGGQFKVAPLELGLSSRPRPLELFKVREPRRSQNRMDAGFGQLQNKRTGVTCTMLIFRVRPDVDPGIVAEVPYTHADPIVRNDLSPCVE